MAEGLRHAVAPLAGFLLGYLVILATPGPNMFAVGSIAALQGLRGALPMVAGIASGTGALAAALVLTLRDVADSRQAMTVIQAAAALLLLRVALAMARCPSAGPRRLPRRPGLGAFLAGFWTAASNPVTAAYVAAGLLPVLHRHAALPWMGATAILLFFGMALGFWLLLAALLARPTLRRVVEVRQRPVRLACAVAVAAMALPMLWPGIKAAQQAMAPPPPTLVAR